MRLFFNRAQPMEMHDDARNESAQDNHLTEYADIGAHAQIVKKVAALQHQRPRL